MLGGPILDNGKFHHITAYFTDPKRICDKNHQRNSGRVGEKLVLTTGPDSSMEIPLLEKDIGSTKWVKGKCFWGMGKKSKSPGTLF